MRDICLTRDEAEMVVDLLETGKTLWGMDRRLELSDDIRAAFGMSPRKPDAPVDPA